MLLLEHFGFVSSPNLLSTIKHINVNIIETDEMIEIVGPNNVIRYYSRVSGFEVAGKYPIFNH